MENDAIAQFTQALRQMVNFAADSRNRIAAFETLLKTANPELHQKYWDLVDNENRKNPQGPVHLETIAQIEAALKLAASKLR